MATPVLCFWGSIDSLFSSYLTHMNEVHIYAHISSTTNLKCGTFSDQRYLYFSILKY